MPNRQSQIKNRQSFHSPISYDHLLRPLVVTRLVTTGRLAPGGYRIAAARSFAFTTTVRMIHRVHRHAAHVRPNSLPARAAGLTKRDVFVLDITYLAHGGATLNRNPANLA